MNHDLTALLVILLAVALALGAGWWMGRRRAAAIEAERTIAIDRAMEQLDRRFDDIAGRQLQENIDNFLRLARENLGGHQQAAHSSLKEREQAIEALINKDRTTWTNLAHGLNDAAMLAFKAIEARDVQGLATAGEKIDEACESCHLRYWYPNQEEQLKKVLERQPQDIRR